MAATVRTDPRMIASRSMTSSLLCLDQWPRILEILVLDRLGRPERERSNGAGRVVAGVLRKRRGAHDEEIGHVPMLAVAIGDAVLRRSAHDCAAGLVRRLGVDEAIR